MSKEEGPYKIVAKRVVGPGGTWWSIPYSLLEFCASMNEAWCAGYHDRQEEAIALEAKEEKTNPYWETHMSASCNQCLHPDAKGLHTCHKGTQHTPQEKLSTETLDRLKMEASWSPSFMNALISELKYLRGRIK